MIARAAAGVLIPLVFLSCFKTSSSIKVEEGGGIVASVIPPAPHPPLSARVRLLVKKNPDPHGEGLVRASSILMEFNEDTRHYLDTPRDDPPQHPLRHRLHSQADQPRNDVTPLVRSHTWYSLHSPVKIYIPVKDELSGIANPKCVHCPKNMTLDIAVGEKDIEVPMPNISVCSRLARSRGRLNVAVAAGPRPGTRVPAGTHPVEMILWKNRGRVHECFYSILVKAPPPDPPSQPITAPEQPCRMPDPPKDGTVACDGGSVCQFFCYPGFVIDPLMTQTALTVCKNGVWTPHAQLKCRATYCPAPKAPQHALLSCDPDDVKSMDMDHPRYREGTACRMLCHAGYMVPLPMKHAHRPIVCNAPHWNDSALPECKQISAPRPHPSDCKNRTLLTNRRGFGRLKAARFYVGQRPVEANCSLPAKLAVGRYVNRCTAVNPEFGVEAECTYHVHVKKNSCPPLPDIPHGVLQCDNPDLSKRTKCQYKCAHGYGVPNKQHRYRVKTCTGKLKWRMATIPKCKKARPPRLAKGACEATTLFLRAKSLPLPLPDFKPFSRESRLTVTCDLNSVSEVGNFTNRCKAVDEEFGLTAECSYNVTVKVAGCPMSTGVSLNCSQSPLRAHYPVGTVCTCPDGFIAPANHRGLSAIKCIGNQEWNTTKEPSCVAQVPPSADCPDRSVPMGSDHQPIFVSSSGQPLQVDCNPANASSVAGLHRVNCTAYDPEMRTFGHCVYGLEVKKAESETEPCPPLAAPSRGFINCSSEANCSLGCDPGRQFASDYSSLHKGHIECRKGRWDFQEDHGIEALPECLGELPNTVVEVWLSFGATSPTCDESMRTSVHSLLVQMNEETCGRVDCESSFHMNCTREEKGQQPVLLNFTWTLQAVFSPAAYAASTDVLDYETDIEAILERVQKFVTLEGGEDGHPDTPRLIKNSYRRSFFQLICQKEGYAVDLNTLKCVECPSGTMQEKEACVPCPPGHHQPKPGQTTCLPSDDS